MPVHLLVLQVLEVTVISTIHTTTEGAPVIVKSLSFIELVRVSEKKVVGEPSGLAFTSMVTPEAGMTEVMETLSGKVGPGAGASVVPVTGVVETTRLASLLQLSDFFFLQYGIATKTNIAAHQRKIVFFIVNISALLSTRKIVINWCIRKLCTTLKLRSKNLHVPVKTLFQ